MDGKNLSFEEIVSILIEKAMKPGKKKWGYRCQKCQETFDSVNHKKYVLIDTYKLDDKFKLSVTGTHEGTMFCSTECATAAIRDTNIYTMYEDLKDTLSFINQENFNHRQLLHQAIAYLSTTENRTIEDLKTFAKELASTANVR